MDSSIKLVCLCVKSSMCSKLPSALCISDLAIYIPTCIRIHVYVLCNVLRPYVANTPCMSYCTINKLHVEQLIATSRPFPLVKCRGATKILLWLWAAKTDKRSI